MKIIENLFNNWIQDYRINKNPDEETLNVLEMIILDKKGVINSLGEIFQDSIKREEWLATIELDKSKILDRFFIDIDSLYHFAPIFDPEYLKLS